MINLIITLISISLIALISMLGIMYLQTSNEEATQEVIKTHLISTGSMIVSSNSLFSVKNDGKLATSIQELINEGYLHNTPDVPKGFEINNEIASSGFIKINTTPKTKDKNKLRFYTNLCKKINLEAGYSGDEILNNGVLNTEGKSSSNAITKQFGCYTILDSNDKDKKNFTFAFK